MSFVLLCLTLICLSATEGYIVDSVNGNDNNGGETVNDPFQTIGRCVEALVNPGDECLIRAGYYHEVITISRLKGKQYLCAINILRTENT